MPADGLAMTYHLNRVAGTLANPLECVGAANVWAGTSGFALVHALNVKAGRPDPASAAWKDLQGVLNELAGTSGLGVNAAAGNLSAPAQVGAVTPTPGLGQVALAWLAPAAGSQPISDYKVEYKTTASGTWLTFADAVSAATGATVTGLVSATSYDFRVSAVNRIGTGPTSAVVSSTPT